MLRACLWLGWLLLRKRAPCNRASAGVGPHVSEPGAGRPRFWELTSDRSATCIACAIAASSSICFCFAHSLLIFAARSRALASGSLAGQADCIEASTAAAVALGASIGTSSSAAVALGAGFGGTGGRTKARYSLICVCTAELIRLSAAATPAPKSAVVASSRVAVGAGAAPSAAAAAVPAAVPPAPVVLPPAAVAPPPEIGSGSGAGGRPGRGGFRQSGLNSRGSPQNEYAGLFTGSQQAVACELRPYFSSHGSDPHASRSRRPVEFACERATGVT